MDALNGQSPVTSVDASLKALMEIATVPVVTIENPAMAVDIAGALIEGGIGAIEVTLRTRFAVEAIRQIANARLDIIVGAGSITSDRDVAEVLEAGADFLVTPATPPALVPSLLGSGKLVLPGVSTPSEALGLYLAGFEVQKIFPASLLGGPKYIAALQAPLSELKLMPSGGISLDNVSEYLTLPNVVAVGVSWLAPPDLQSHQDWKAITRNCEQLAERLNTALSD
ncbi:bifunctional 4-hydroxy-2-oxoglutarate aldolase/2-dehydro-3-deoxy-phosphogluconate aldolase [Henriciella marina]|uniref:bifunctional 4-hydroxy-2-oxoglutarate aldolase/2-dehydro-3-deoxy-phosphogluconate aldolase n=1 Tax=Henriciella marina TaxID=453851 RepID=UPI0003600D26|nr:bifunctional 4-hydroxy-2-oxoglutarate aldolase/2-dehydro-3-deoxy-phosphogluconate aldolase [Henriciella marina]